MRRRRDGHPAVAIHNDLAAGQARVALRSADDKASRGVDEKLGFLVEQMRWQNFLDDLLDDKILDFLVLHVMRVLRGDNHVRDAHGLVVFVLNGDLAFGVGSEPIDLAGFPDARQFPPKLVGIHDRRGHQLGGFGAGIAEHETLVAGALLGGFLAVRGLGIDALGDVGALRGDRVHDEHLVGVKNIIVVRVADFANGLTGNGAEVKFRLGGDFAADHDQVALGVGLARDAAAGILRQTGVEDGVGNCVADFVRMAFADGLGGEYEVFAHVKIVIDRVVLI